MVWVIVAFAVVNGFRRPRRMGRTTASSTFLEGKKTREWKMALRRGMSRRS